MRTRSLSFCVISMMTLIIALAAILASCMWKNGHGWGDDFAAYLAQTQSILSGDPSSYAAENRLTVDESPAGYAPYAYPWGFPILLTPAYVVFGLNVTALRWSLLGLYLLVMPLLFHLFRKRAGIVLSLAIVALCAFNPSLLNFSNSLISDLPFFLFSMLSLLLIDRWVLNHEILRNSKKSVLLGMTLLFTFLIRSSGIILLPILLICQAVSISQTFRQSYDKSRFFRHLLPLFSFAALYLLMNTIFPGGGKYPFSTPTVASSLQNIKYYFTLPAQFFYGLPATEILYGATLPFLCLGMFARFKRDYHLILYVVFTVALHIVYPYRDGIRYLFPLLPFYLYFTFQGLSTLRFDHQFQSIRWVRQPEILSRAVACLLIALFFMASTVSAYRNVTGDRNIDGPFAADSAEMFGFIKAQTRDQDIIVFFKPRAMRLFTGRKSFAAIERERLLRGDYVVIHKQMGNYLQVVPDAAAAIVFENATFRVFQMKKEKQKVVR